MIPARDLCASAAVNVRHGINRDRRFPLNVFVGDWEEFLFFDSDWMFAAEFVQYIKTLLDLENGACACLLNLDSATAGEKAERLFFIDRQTTPGTYQSLLSGDGPASGWAYDVDRYGCSSDTGAWCMYCERANEIAVIALRSSSSLERYRSGITQFHAVRFREAVEEPLSYGFSALPMPWRAEALRQYAARPLAADASGKRETES
ncbi:MAG: hypothetical protein WBD07_13275 [Vicinamibacterales bacterium]